MLTLQGEHIKLRALEPEDLTHVHRIENDEKLWHLSETVTPYSVHSIKEYVDNAHRDVYEVKQLRLVICDVTTDAFVGFIDLFDFDPLNLRAGVGIVIESTDDRGQGYGKEALQLLLKYCKKHLQLHQLFANIGADNPSSIRLFEKLGFELIGIKKDWRRSGTDFIDELLYQHIL
ncbi:N-acetyltransferase [Dokdonia sinensis]|uniref:N-acetyltransferase n=1 Tax=Dokdonia sinensis TaxID=2479847 RepID=A0A3M0G9H4_9FLAO|nr:GNAT family N-acetyltransferase [Dokdonia sinensis]RMB61068.1 N-acetyltransferase [Dokdonia sinensis]